MSADTPVPPSGFVPGSRIAGYRLVQQIGLGGMAVVFRAHDERLDRQVALKILAPGLARDNAFRQRFIRESRAAAAVDDPHIIPVFEAGEASGVLFIAMRYVPDGDVRTLLDREGPLPAARAMEIISQVASALDNAHVHGLVHRDVKPANMLLGAIAGPDRPDHVYLSDFGLSKQSLMQTGLTSTGQFLGTLDYVSPEQIEGRPVDGRADLYALACASFELLSGAPPFRREEGLAVMHAQLTEPPPALSARRAGLPPAVDAVFARALAKSPADRFATCREFATALREALGLHPVDTGPGASPTVSRPRTEIAMPVAGPGAADTGVPAAQWPAAAEAWNVGQPGPGAGTGAAVQAGPAQPWAAEPAGGMRQPAASAGPPTREISSWPPGGTTPGATDPRAGPPGAGGQDYGQPSGPRRSSRRAMAAIAAVVAVLAIAGGAYALLGRGSGGGGPAVALPGCTTKAASTPVLSKVRQASVPVSGSPFAVQVGRGGQYTFVSVGNSVVMLKNGSGLGLTPFRTIAAPGAVKGEAITHNGKYLLVANNGDGAVVISVAMAKHGASNPVLGRLSSPGGKGAVEIALSPDDRFAFVTLQGSAEMAVFNLQQAKASGWRHSGFAGFVPLGIQPVGITESRGWLYVTSFQRNLSTTQGTISVVSMKTAETKPGRAAVVSTAGAGCSPARVALAPNGVLWVTARESNMLLAFSAAKLRTDPAHALLARVAVGQEPIGEMLIRSGSRIVVADSDYHNVANSAPSLAVVDTKKALAGKPALVGLIKTGRVPRQFDLEKDGKTLLVTNQGSHLVQAISVATIP